MFVYCVLFQISYCQGMSDIASPILAVMDNEAHAFICFCGIMKRLEGNFRPDGQFMSVKFQHLKLLLKYSDPEFYSYLVSKGADDLFFCYRWLLLELKREFAFDDALRMLEVTWSSLPPDPPETEVELLGPPLKTLDTSSEKVKTVVNGLGDNDKKEMQRRRHMLRPSQEPVISIVINEKDKLLLESNQTADNNDKVSSLSFERKTSFGEFKYYTARSADSFDTEDADLPQEFPHGPNTTKSILTSCQCTFDSEDDPGQKTPLIQHRDSTLASLLPSVLPMFKTSPQKSSSNDTEDLPRTVVSTCSNSSTGTNSTIKTFSPSHPRTLLSSPILSFRRGQSGSQSKSISNNLSSPGNKSLSTTATKVEGYSVKPCSLPPPQEFGKGNPFMLFLCLSILLEHRDHIIKNSLDYNELAMHFDRLVRRHNLGRVLQRAKALFADYLQSEVWDSEEGDEVSSDSPTTATTTPLCLPATVPARPIYSPLGSPQASSPNSTYNLATTIPSSTAHASLSPTL